MSNLIYSLIDLGWLTTGRRLYAFRHCLEAVLEGEASVGALIQEAIAHDLQTSEMERSWARSRHLSTARGEAASIDGQIDGVYGAIHGTLKNHVHVLSGADPIAGAAQTILSQIFPEGVQPIITLPFEDQLVVNDNAVSRLNGGDLSAAASTAGIGAYAARLKTLNDAFRVELRKSQTKETSYDVIEAAQTEGNLFVRRIAAVVLGTYHQNTEADAARRQALLSPILDQCERVRRSRKGRRAPQDIDPETGVEVPDIPAE
jgi:hypothetical protein